MIDRRGTLRLTAFAAAAALSGTAGAQTSSRHKIGVSGRLDARTIGRFVQTLRQNKGEVLDLDVTGTEADEPGGTFDIGEGRGNDLTIEYRAGRRNTVIKIDGLYRKLPNSPARYAIRGSYSVIAGPADSPNIETLTLSEVQERYLDRSGTYPRTRL